MAEAVPPLEPDDEEEAGEAEAFPSYEEFATDLLTAIDAVGFLLRTSITRWIQERASALLSA